MAVVPVVAFFGRSDCGKTTLLEKLIQLLSGRGYRIGVVKHHVHGPFSMDVPGKDSWRHKQAGARTVVLSSPVGLGMVKDCRQDATLTELLCRYFFDVDLVLAEGYKQGDTAKIAVCRNDLRHRPFPEPVDNTLIATVSDLDPGRDLPWFDLDDIAGIADFLIKTFLPSSQPDASGPEISLLKDGVPITLSAVDRSRILDTLASLPAAIAPDQDSEEIFVMIRSRKGKADGC
ncbi:MAG: molybdopterin-guanine dinucleotide biosynthesis protein B [Desulfobacterales bacterium]|nr:molybdopterin-guanine dinucleotide biosynthesis protein B [Desulfobacterales bacterium]